MKGVTPFSLEIFRHILSGLTEEMGAALMRTAFSPNIKERLDFSCALMDRHGRLVAQASHIPVHLGSMPRLIEYVLEHHDMAPGDVWIANDPYRGGTHLPDLTMMAPLFVDGQMFAIVANRAHHSDIGGSAPGSMPLSEDIYQEGIVVPPVALVRRGRPVIGVRDLFLNNVRTPVEREGDLDAQAAANTTGLRRLQEVIKRYGVDVVQEHMDALLAYSERLTREGLGGLPRGTWSFQDALETPGSGEAIPIRVKVTLDGPEAWCDFHGTAPLQPNCLNAPRSVTEAAVYYVFRCLLGDHIPPNHGGFAPIHLMIPEDCMLSARPPYPVAGGNVETSQRVVDVVLGALAQALPGQIPAASAGTMNNLSFGGWDASRGRPFTYYETIGGGCGASARHDGRSAVQTHMTNTQNTPAEALEMELPVRVRRYSIRPMSGGSGARRGGDGIVRELEFLAPARVTLLMDRRHRAPYGLEHGAPGAVGQNLLDGRPLDGKASFDVAAGQVLTVETPGGGGYGPL